MPLFQALNSWRDDVVFVVFFAAVTGALPSKSQLGEVLWEPPRSFETSVYGRQLLRREALIGSHRAEPSDSALVSLFQSRINESEPENDAQQQQQYHCFPFGLEDKCFNITASPMWAKSLCDEKASGGASGAAPSQEFLPDDLKLVLAPGSCPKAVYHCKDAGASFECTTFSYEMDGSSYRYPNVDGDSVINARSWCVAWESNRNINVFSEVFGTGPCPPPPVYHCLDKLEDRCFNFSYGEREYTKLVFPTDDAEHAADYCVNLVNAALDTVSETDVFGNGPCTLHLADP